MTRIAVVGATGRMGKVLVEAVATNEEATLTAATVRLGSADAGSVDVGEYASVGHLGIIAVDDLSAVVEQFDVVIDFTTPEATLKHLEICANAGKKMVIGTTGFSPDQLIELQRFGESQALVFAANFSVGVNAAFHLLGVAAEILGNDVDIDITEAHHKHKVDAPSGTALRMGEIIENKLERATTENKLNYNSIRAGDIVGEHTVMFVGAGERIEITHRAMSRMNFASGAVRAALWLKDKPAGMFDMQDVLGLS